MPTIGFHASHEQLPPSALLRAVRRSHPALAAQAMATLAELFPGRFIDAFADKVLPAL